MTFKYRYRKQIIIVVISLIIIGTSSFFVYSNFKESKKPKKEENLLIIEKKEKKKEEKNKKEKEEESIPIMVDVKGEVINPGIYTLDKDKRVIDAINMAGGLTNHADTSVLNLSKKLTDEMVIIVYSRYEVENFEKTKEKERTLNQECVKGVNALENNACIEKKQNQVETSSKKVSINQASKEEFMQLEGIGEAKATAIIEYRNTNGLFHTIEDIKNVTGIGDSLFDKIKENITL